MNTCDAFKSFDDNLFRKTNLPPQLGLFAHIRTSTNIYIQDLKNVLSLNKCHLHSSSSKQPVSCGDCDRHFWRFLSPTINPLLERSPGSRFGHVVMKTLLCQGTRSASHYFRSCTHMLLNPGGQERRIITVPYYMWEDLIKSVCHYLSVSLSQALSLSL